MKEYVINSIKDSLETKKKCLEDSHLNVILKMAETIKKVMKSGNKVLIFGNGGSASDSLHIAAELVGRFEKERVGLCAIALSANISNLTAIGNDYGFDNIFNRQIEALGKEGDVAIGLTTSGNSKNVLLALKKAKEIGMLTLGLAGEKKTELDEISDCVFHAPSSNTARVQECHIMAGHIICGLVEKEF